MRKKDWIFVAITLILALAALVLELSGSKVGPLVAYGAMLTLAVYLWASMKKK